VEAGTRPAPSAAGRRPPAPGRPRERPRLRAPAEVGGPSPGDGSRGIPAEAGGPTTATSAALPAVPARPARAVLADYLSMTKPKVQSLLLFTTVATMYVAGDPSLGLVAATCLGGALSAGGAGAINHWYDRDIDAVMRRTRERPVASGRVSPLAALGFGVVLGVASFALLAMLVNLLAAALALGGLLGYVLVYTVWLKRVTPQNIVIGGAAGAVPPLVAWAAVTGSLEGSALYLFAIVFYWTPPHFWALSLLMREEYERAGVPMLPVVRGEAETRRQIVLYTLLLVAVTVLPFAGGLFGAAYLAAALALGGAFAALALRLRRRSDRRSALRVYLFSLAYLAALFAAMVVDVQI
jgi:protoheme IX farnesyltransferase